MTRAAASARGAVTSPTYGTLRVLGWAAHAAMRHWHRSVLVLALVLGKICFDLLKPWPMKILVDQGLQSLPAPAWLAAALDGLSGDAARRAIILGAVAATIVVFLLSWLLTTASQITTTGFAKRLAYDVAADLFVHLQRLSLRFHYRKPTGDTIRRVTNDSSCVATIVQGAFVPMITSVVTLGLIFGILWQLSPALTLASLGVLPLMGFGFRRYAEPMMRHGYRQQEEDAETYSVIERTLAAMPAIQAFGRERDADLALRTATERTLEAAVAATDVQMRFKMVIGAATALGTAAILYFGARQALSGELTIGSIIVFLSYLASLYQPLESIAYSSSTIQGAAGSARRVLEILESQPEVTEAPGARRLGRVAGRVQIENVSFGYEPGRRVLHGVSLEAAPGETLAIVGATGAGKSTLVALIPRFFDPDEGAVRIDGHDLRTLKVADLRRSVAMVLQEPFLFPISVRDNIAYGRPEADFGAVEAAAAAANAHEFIAALPRGYDTVVGEGGGTLSGGQRQRLAIARALLVDAPVLILDEPTSALDAGSEALVVQALQRLMRGRTTFIIAHRLSTIRHADRIVVMDSGTVAEAGTHGELLARGGRFAHLHDLQFGPRELPPEEADRSP